MSRQFPVLRGLAILFVLINHSIAMSLWMASLYHYPTPSQAVMIILTSIKEIGVFAVPIFLFLSGSFFGYALQKRTTGKAYRTVLQSLQGVILPYLIWSVVFYLITYLVLGEQFSLVGYLKNLLVGYPFNFVPLLIFFYLVSPLLLLAIKKFPVLSMLAILIYQLFVANILNPSIFGLSMPAWTYNLTPPVLRVTFSNWGIFFPLGMVYYQFMRTVNEPMKKYALPIGLVTILLFVLNILYLMQVINLPIAGILCPVVGLLLIPTIQRDQVPGHTWIERIGKYSYGLFLTNLTVITLLLSLIHLLFPWLLEYYLVLVPVILVPTLYIPWGLMLYIERPPQRMVYPYLFG